MEPILPGINFSPRQLFWLSSARVWCNAKRPGALKKQVGLSDQCAHMLNDDDNNDVDDDDDDDDVDDDEDHLQVLTDPHSPAQFRVNGPLANLREFSQVRFVQDGENTCKCFAKKEFMAFVEV